MWKDKLKENWLKIFIVTFLLIDIILVWMIVHYRLMQNEDTITVNSDFGHTIVQPDDGINVMSPEINIETDFE